MASWPVIFNLLCVSFARLSNSSCKIRLLNLPNLVSKLNPPNLNILSISLGLEDRNMYTVCCSFPLWSLKQLGVNCIVSVVHCCKTSHFLNYSNEHLVSGLFCRLVFQGDTLLTYSWVTDYLQTWQFESNALFHCHGFCSSETRYSIAGSSGSGYKWCTNWAHSNDVN